MKVKKYVDNDTLNWEERYRRLERHHMEETKELIAVVEGFEIIKAFGIFKLMVESNGPEQFAWSIAFFFRNGVYEQ